MVLIKNLKFFHLFIFGKIRKENVFDNILETKKKLFLYYKKQEVKKSKNWHFSNLHGFAQKFENFPSFLLLAKSTSKICLTIF